MKETILANKIYIEYKPNYWKLKYQHWLDHTKQTKISEWLQYVREKVNHALTLDMMEVEKFEERKKDYEEEKAERRRLSY